MGAVLDEQTGKTYELSPENRADTVLAFVSITYLLLMLLLILWFLFDVWYTAVPVIDRLGYADLDKLRTSSNIRLVAYTVIGGALGGTVNGIRSFLLWHCERQAFGRRFTWKYISDPWLGATLALIVFAVLQSGVAVIGGEISPTSIGTTQMVAMFGVGALAGYGSRSVFIWLDVQVNRLFRTDGGQQVETPNLTGKTEQQAIDDLGSVGLMVGNKVPKAGAELALIGTVVEQTPAAGTMVLKSSKVDIHIGAA